jgi:hypothetical protein
MDGTWRKKTLLTFLLLKLKRHTADFPNTLNQCYCNTFNLTFDDTIDIIRNIFVTMKWSNIHLTLLSLYRGCFTEKYEVRRSHYVVV